MRSYFRYQCAKNEWTIVGIVGTAQGDPYSLLVKDVTTGCCYEVSYNDLGERVGDTEVLAWVS